MQVLLSCHDMLSDALKNELSRYGLPSLESGKTYVITEGAPNKIAYFLLRAQTPVKAIKLISRFTFEDYADFELKLKENVRSSEDALLPPKFVVRCARHGLHDFRSPDIASVASNHLRSLPRAPPGIKDEFLHTVVFYIQDNQAFMGIDLAGEDMSKRDYRIFRNNSSFKGTVAASMLYLAGLKKGQRLVDAFCKDGTVAIEAAFLSGKSILRKFSWENFALTKLDDFKEVDFKKIIQEEKDELQLKIYASDKSNHNISSAKKNAQIAGLKGEIDFFREDVSWLSTRFEENSVDAFASFMPSPSASFPEKRANRLYSEFLENSVPLLRDSGIITAAMTSPESFIETASSFGLKQRVVKSFMMGHQEAFIIILEK